MPKNDKQYCQNCGVEIPEGNMLCDSCIKDLEVCGNCLYARKPTDFEKFNRPQNALICIRPGVKRTVYEDCYCVMFEGKDR